MEEHFNDVEKKIEEFLNQLDFRKYRLHEALYYFKEDDFGDIISLLHATKLPKKYDTYKEVLQEKISIKLGLGSNDLLLCSNGLVYGKIFFQVDPAPEGTDKRACGLAPELLVAYKQKFFPKNSHREEIGTLLVSAVETILSFRKLTPIEFKKIFIPVLVNIVEIVVIEHTDLEDLRSIRGMSYYLLREIFDDMMLYIADDILFNFSNQDKKAIEFLSHFSVYESIDAKGNRYKPTPILDESNHAWNMTTIRSTMLQYKKSKQVMYDKKNSLVTIKKKLESYKIEQKQLSKQIVREKETLKEVEAKIAHIHATVDRLQNTDAIEVKFVENGEEKVFKRQVLIGKLFKKEDEVLNQKNKLQRGVKEIEQVISNKQKDIYIWEKKYAEIEALLASIEANGHPIDRQYERIQRALAKTLAKR